MKTCIICKGKLEKLLELKNMPATAQDIPTGDNLSADKGMDIALCSCLSCGLVQLDTPAVSYYRDVIRASAYSTTMEALRRKQYEEFISLCRLEGEKILELGCGGGEFLRILADYPVRAYGVEHNADLVKKAREAGLQVWRDFPESGEHCFAEAPFKAFTSFNFLEHQPEPLNYLRAIYHNLEEEAYGLLTVPSFEYILEQESFYEIIPDHIAYYTMDSLKTLLSNAGFRVLKEERINRDTLSVIVQKKIRPEITPLLRQKEEIQKQVYALTESFTGQGRKLAVWGASHQGFTLCATLHLQDKIACIIDSAPFKQGKYAPASHIPIVSPAEAGRMDLDAILIVAPGYTAEIAALIRRDFARHIKIYTLRSRQIEEYDEE